VHEVSSRAGVYDYAGSIMVSRVATTLVLPSAIGTTSAPIALPSGSDEAQSRWFAVADTIQNLDAERIGGAHNINNLSLRKYACHWKTPFQAVALL
jgi:hypothetical protein